MSPNQIPEKAGLAALNVVRGVMAGVGETVLRIFPSGSTLDNAATDWHARHEVDAAIAQLSCRVEVDMAPLDTPEQ